MFFVVFNLEAVFLFPWAGPARELGWAAGTAVSAWLLIVDQRRRPFLLPACTGHAVLSSSRAPCSDSDHGSGQRVHSRHAHDSVDLVWSLSDAIAQLDPSNNGRAQLNEESTSLSVLS
jgi:hypothetical protein